MQSRAFITQWAQDQLAYQRKVGHQGLPLNRTGSPQLSRLGLKPGDRLYVVGLKNINGYRKLLLIGRLTFERLLSEEAAQAEAGDEQVFPAPWHAVGAGTPVDLDRIVPNKVVHQLERSTGTPIKVGPDGVDRMALLNTGEIMSASAKLLDALL